MKRFMTREEKEKMSLKNKAKAKSKKFKKSAKYSAFRKKWNHTYYLKHKDYFLEYVKKQRSNEEFATAYYVFFNAVQSGKVVRPDRCEICSSTKNIQAHHEDYSKPLDVQWLCVKCHNDVHHNQKAA